MDLYLTRTGAKPPPSAKDVKRTGSIFLSFADPAFLAELQGLGLSAGHVGADELLALVDESGGMWRRALGSE